MFQKISGWYRTLLLQDEGLHVLLILLLLIIFVAYPLQAMDVTDLVIVKAFITLLTVSGIWAISQNRKRLFWIIAIAVLSMLFQWARSLSDETWIIITSLCLASLFECLLAYFILLRTFAPGHVNLFRVEGSVVVYLLMGVILSSLYTLIYIIEPTAFNFADPPKNFEVAQSRFMYFSFITLTTIGYGDIQPLMPISQSAAMLEGLIGQLFPAILIARLVSQSISENKS